MPYADEIKFEVTQDVDCMGTYLYDDGGDF